MQHLGYLKLANTAFAALMALIGLLCVAMIGIPVVLGLMSGQMGGGEVVILAVTALLSMLACLAFAAFYWVLGRKVARGRWRIVQTVAAVLSLSSFPLGTGYAIYALWVCWMNQETKDVFDDGGVYLG